MSGPSSRASSSKGRFFSLAPSSKGRSSSRASSSEGRLSVEASYIKRFSSRVASEESVRHDKMAAAMVPDFPMYVMEAAVLLDLQRLEPHQTLLQRGHIRKFNPDTDLVVIFGSHQSSDGGCLAAFSGRSPFAARRPSGASRQVVRAVHFVRYRPLLAPTADPLRYLCSAAALIYTIHCMVSPYTSRDCSEI
jgi:hypothetical protein